MSKETFFENIFKKIVNVLNNFIFIFLVLVIWQFNAFCIIVFFTVNVSMNLALVFTVLTALFLNVYETFLYYRNFHEILCVCAYVLFMFYKGFSCLLILMITSILIPHQVILFFIFTPLQKIFGTFFLFKFGSIKVVT